MDCDSAFVVVGAFLPVEIADISSVHNLSSHSNIQPGLGIKLLTCIYIWTWVPLTCMRVTASALRCSLVQKV